MRDAFREKRLLTDPQLISRQYSFGQDQLRLLRRQVTTLARIFSCFAALLGKMLLFFSDAAEPDVLPAEASSGEN